MILNLIISSKQQDHKVLFKQHTQTDILLQNPSIEKAQNTLKQYIPGEAMLANDFKFDTKVSTFDPPSNLEPKASQYSILQRDYSNPLATK